MSMPQRPGEISPLEVVVAKLQIVTSSGMVARTTSASPSWRPKQTQAREDRSRRAPAPHRLRNRRCDPLFRALDGWCDYFGIASGALKAILHGDQSVSAPRSLAGLLVDALDNVVGNRQDHPKHGASIARGDAVEFIYRPVEPKATNPPT